jgi:BA14K-like protein
MEPVMISFRVLGSVAAIALVLPMAAPRASLAQPVSIGKAPGHSGPVGGGGAPPTARFNGGGGSGGGGPVYIGRGGGGGGWQGGTAGVYHRHGGGFIPGAVAGAVIGGAIAAAPYGYYSGGPYDAPGYYDEQYYDNGPVVVAPEQGSADTVDYCSQTYRSYDSQSGTYLGLDGLRHLCP